jgi:hypothetical protein
MAAYADLDGVRTSRGPVSFDLMADDTVAFLERVVGGQARVEKPDLCHRIILDFLTNDPVPTLAPVRRARRARHAPPVRPARTPHRRGWRRRRCSRRGP